MGWPPSTPPTAITAPFTGSRATNFTPVLRSTIADDSLAVRFLCRPRGGAVCMLGCMLIISLSIPSPRGRVCVSITEEERGHRVIISRSHHPRGASVSASLRRKGGTKSHHLTVTSVNITEERGHKESSSHGPITQGARLCQHH